ncbi:hypothetical protein BB560_005892 [Smittium megazygosporum]|uniref:Sugar phosphate transporter domain-containing protein n=1 Tax=Smittium megazygosporum TaxID=133381 RepID=A0A2T9YRY2_9FUNG|nr:hypothetical protein BB560_005892 [Smittium megazygosporum]
MTSSSTYTIVSNTPHYEIDVQGNSSPNHINEKQHTFNFHDYNRTDDSFQVIFLCILLYSLSAISGNLLKSILQQFPFPVTLTLIQFFFRFSFLFVFAILNPSKLHYKVTLENIKQVFIIASIHATGHIINHTAISYAPVSLVYMIKGISPLLTIAICRTLFGMRYSKREYISLIPLVTGVCLTSFKANGLPLIGFLFSLLGSVTVAAGGIASKHVVSKSQFQAKAHESIPYVKYRVLYYSTITSFFLTLPIWLWSESSKVLSSTSSSGILASDNPLSDVDLNSTFSSVIAFKILLLCVFHTFQSFASISLVSITSPVTFSICSLLKRVVIIIASIIWSRQVITTTQFFGLSIFFVGLYLYTFAKKS